MELQGRDTPGPAGDVSTLFKSFDRGEILRLYQPLMLFYREKEPETYPVVQAQLEKHVQEVYRVIQRFRTGGHPLEC